MGAIRGHFHFLLSFSGDLADKLPRRHVDVDTKEVAYELRNENNASGEGERTSGLAEETEIKSRTGRCSIRRSG